MTVWAGTRVPRQSAEPYQTTKKGCLLKSAFKETVLFSYTHSPLPPKKDGLPAIVLAGSPAEHKQRSPHPSPVPPAGEAEMRQHLGVRGATPAGVQRAAPFGAPRVGAGAGQSPAAPRVGAGAGRSPAAPRVGAKATPRINNEPPPGNTRRKSPHSPGLKSPAPVRCQRHSIPIARRCIPHGSQPAAQAPPRLGQC